MKNFKLLSLGFMVLGFCSFNLAGCAAKSESECHGKADCKDKKDCKDCKKMKKGECKECQKKKAK